MDYILSVRNILDNNTFGVELGAPTYLQIPSDESKPLPSHHTMDGIKSWMDVVTEDVNRSYDGNIVIFVHGFNNSSEQSLNRQRIIEAGLHNAGYNCKVIGFDWPSAESVVGYLYDREEAHNASHTLITSGLIPFIMYNKPDCSINVHLIAHSMGAYVIREAFRGVDKLRKATIPSDWRIGQIIFAGGDISANCFVEDDADLESIFKHCGHLTNYFNGYDEILAVSNLKRLDLEPRVGRVGIPINATCHDKAIDVDCSARYKHQFGTTLKVLDVNTTHAWYFNDTVWYNDLAHTLNANIDHALFPNRTAVGNNDYVLASY